MPDLKIRDAGAWKTPTDMKVRDAGAWKSVKELYTRYYDSLTETWSWVRVYWQAPTVAPTNPTASADSDYDVVCTVDAYSTTYPGYRLYVELYTSNEASLVASGYTNEGINSKEFFDLTSWDGYQVKFKARYDDDGKGGPWSGWSNLVTISGGL